jgi:hypothetical protein
MDEKQRIKELEPDDLSTNTDLCGGSPRVIGTTSIHVSPPFSTLLVESHT